MLLTISGPKMVQLGGGWFNYILFSMKILIVIDSLGSGGAQKLAVNLAKGLEKKGHIVEIFIYHEEFVFFQSELSKSKIKIHKSRRKPGHKHKTLNSLKVILQLRNLLKENYDGVLSFLHTPSIYCAIAGLGILKKKLVVCELSSSNAPVNSIKKLLFYLTSLSSKMVVANSFSEAALIRKKLGLKHKVTAIWNGYNLSSIPFNDNYNDTNINDIIIVGRIAYPKNGLNLLKALKLFLERNESGITIKWAGRKDNDQKSIKMQKEMMEYIKQNPIIKSNIIFLGEVKDIYELYQNAAALIHPSIYEGLPMVICEAMLLGCPIIASNISDHPLILDNDRGILFNPNSPTSICQAIEKFNLMTLNQKVEMAEKARSFAENNFTTTKMVESFENILTL